ncbi:MAG: MBL fold metallo-hydrolase [Clostridia bacterium]|nr:MBL fold metallo-hydrolase [Clostridia bacterium]
MSVTFCALSSGSKGNCYLVAGNKTKILVDAGISAKAICDDLINLGVSPEEIDGIIVTHEHSDHINGIKTFSKKFSVPVYANEKTMGEIVRKFKDIEQKNIRVFNNGESFYIGDLDISPFKTPHDSVSSCGFSIFNGNCKVTVATDLGHMTRGVLEACKQSDILVLEANHDLEMLMNGPYSPFLKQRVQGPNGHLSNDLCGKTVAYLLDYGLKQVILAHLSEDNNTPEIAYQTVCQHLASRGAQDKKDVNIDIALQSKCGKCYRIV